MEDYRQHLLRSEADVKAFREKYAVHIDRNRQNFIDWVEGFPVMEKIRYLDGFSEKHRPFAVGLLCILVSEGAISVTFHDRAQILHRNPRDIKEWECWCDSLVTRRRERIMRTKG